MLNRKLHILPVLTLTFVLSIFNTVYADEVSDKSLTDEIGLKEFRVSYTTLWKSDLINIGKLKNRTIYFQESIPAVIDIEEKESNNLYSIDWKSSDIWRNKFEEHCSLLTKDKATEENLVYQYELAGYLWRTKKLDMYDLKKVLYELEYTYLNFGIFKDKNVYLAKFQKENYQENWNLGTYDKYLESIWGYGNLGNPYNYKSSHSGEMVLATAYAVAESWTKGTSGEKLRYSQETYSIYSSQISDKVFQVRPDCTGFCYTILKELGCTIIDSESCKDGFYSGRMVNMCKSGEMETDPNLMVLPFNVNSLKPGDIMVTSKTETLTKWNTQESYGAREGHAEVFVGFPDENDKSVIDVWNWGSTNSVNNNFPVNAETFLPQRKHHPYNYTYIIRYIGGERH